MQKKLPLILAVLSVAAIGILVLSRGWQTVSRQVEPQVGRECFEAHRPLLPVGSQYEGFEATENAVRVKVMTGIELRTVECALAPNGTLDTPANAK
jgi:hypothetical protein